MALGLSLLPILLILVLMAAFNLSAEKAGLIGYLACVAIGIVFFGVTKPILYYGHLKGLWFAVDVLLIIWASYLFYLVLEEAGIVTIMEERLPQIAPSKGMQAYVLGWIFASFLQGVGGFGVPVAVIAPILINLGFEPLQAILIPSVGHGWGVTFGSLGSSFRALLAVSSHPIYPLNLLSAIMLALTCILSGWICLFLVDGWKELRRSFLWVTSSGLIMGGFMLFGVWMGVWNLGTFLGAMGGLLWFIFLVRLIYNHQQISPKTLRELGVVFSGFGILIGVIFAVNFIPFLVALLNRVNFHLTIPALETVPSQLSIPSHATPAGKVAQVAILSHPGIVLFYAILFLVFWFKYLGRLNSASIRQVGTKLVRRLISTTIGIWAMVTMSILMEMSGMTNAIAHGLSAGFSRVYPLVSLIIGAIGAFMTGSNTNSNVLFAPLQMQTAQLLGYPTALILAAQTAAASIGSTLAPAKIIVGTSTSGLKGKEGVILRKLLPIVLIQILFLAAIVYILLGIERIRL
ncbi:MAG: L-lactate permease [Anaerolineales bacterium]|nr:L-lactate permease [Anaerolineales bacterium]